MKQRKVRIFNLVLAFVFAMGLILNGSIAMVFAEATSLQEQINNAQNGTEISLTKDYNEAITIPSGKEIILDLNGHTLTSPTNTVIKNEGVLTVKDSVGSGKIYKESQEGDTFGINNFGTLHIKGGSIEVSTVVRNVSHGVNNNENATLSMSGGNIYSLTTGENWAFGIFNRGKITEISGGSIKGQIKKSGNGFNALGISNEQPATIELISGGTISAEVDNNGKAWGIRNRGNIGEIKGGSIIGTTTGSAWAFGIWNTANGKINKISGGSLEGYIKNPANGNNALGISNHGDNDNPGTPVIDLVTGGLFIGQTEGPGGGFGLRTDGVVNSISGGAYRGNNAGNALVRRSGTMNLAPGFILTEGVGLRYVMPEDGFYVDLLDKEENWIATFIYNKSGELTSSSGDIQDKYTVFNWKKDDSNKTVECTSEDFKDFKENTTLYVKNTDKPLLYFLGSSVTYGHTTGGVSFVDHLAKDNDWITMKRAVSGTTLVDNGANSYIQRMKNEINPNAPIDHFICQLSTNDATQNKPLGKVSDSKNIKDFDTSTIIGAMEYIIAYAYENWNCPVTFYTNPRYTSKHYEKMIDALYELQEKWDINIIDFYNYVDMEPLTASKLSSYMSDPIHPNANGYKWMAEVMSELLVNNPNSGRETEEPTAPTPTPTEAPTPTGNNDDNTPKPTSPDNEDNTGTGDSSIVVMMLLLAVTGITMYKIRKHMKMEQN